MTFKLNHLPFSFQKFLELAFSISLFLFIYSYIFIYVYVPIIYLILYVNSIETLSYLIIYPYDFSAP